MDNNPGDSSSESDISDPWSIIDRDSCDTDEIPGGNSGVGSVYSELSDGESLEVIDEEDQHEGEFQETGMETDGVSIVTDSEINEELDETLPSALSKGKKYLHHPNTYLNTRLNVLLALSFAAVTGLGVGHFLGLQEECPMLDTSLTAQLAKLQQENEFLQSKLNHLLHERQESTKYEDIEDWEYRSESKLRNNGIDLRPCLEPDVNGQPSQQVNEPHVEFDNERLTHTIPGAFFKVIQNNRDEINNFMEVQKESVIASAVLQKEKQNVIEDGLLDKHSIPTSEDVEVEDGVVRLKNFIEIINSRLHSNDEKDIEEDSDVREGMDTEEKINKIELKNAYEDGEKHDLNENENVIDVKSKEKDSDSFMIKGEENFTGTSSASRGKFIYLSNKNSNIIISEEHVDESDQQNRIYPDVVADVIKEEDENNLQIIKSTLELLKIHFNKDILSADTESILASAVMLAMEHEQSLIHLQNTIAECKVRNDNFCVQFQKRMKTSASKLKETTEQLVDDIDEQMHKLLTKIVRKFKKFKNNVQNKWCHLKNVLEGTNQWLESSLLLDCKKNKKEYNLKPKSYEHSSKNVIKNSLEDIDKHKNSEIYITKTFSEHDNKQSISDNAGNNHENVLEKNWMQNKHHLKDFNKDKKKRESGQNFIQNKKNKFQHKKSELYNKEKKTWNNLGTMNDKRDDLRKENTRNHYVILDHSKTWPSLNVKSSKQNNVSGDWILKLADGRAEQRKLSHRSDWIFDRADARKIKREKYQIKDDWYFQRARGREDCRYNSYSDWCKGRYPNDCYLHNKEENERKLPRTNRWSKKFTSAFATAGKWVKDSFSRFENKMNYHHH